MAINGSVERLAGELILGPSLARSSAHTEALVALGHARWEIENQGFNEAVNHWHTDHVYKHSGNAILTFWLTAMLAINIFHAFRVRNLKAEAWRQVSCQHISRCLASELYRDAPQPRAQPPPAGDGDNPV